MLDRASAKGWAESNRPIRVGDINVLTRGDPVKAVALLEREGFQAHGRKDLPRYPLGPDFDWSVDPFSDRNWLFQAEALRMLDPYLLAFGQTGESDYLAGALEWMVRWCHSHIGAEPVPAFAWYDMAVGLRAMKLACLLDLGLRGRIPAEESRLEPLLDAWEPHANALMEPGALASNNHAFFQLHGLRALARLLPEHELADQANRYVGDQMPGLLRKQFTDDGVHREHSPSYHMFACNLLSEFFSTGWYAEIAQATRIVERAQALKRWLCLPDGRHVMVGDSSGRGGVSPPDLVDSNAGVCRAFDNGYALVRGAGSPESPAEHLLFFMGAHESRAHKHADDQSFVWYDKGQLILTDSGKYAYEQDRWREYVTSTRAHNTVEVDRGNYGVGAGHAYGSAVEAVSQSQTGQARIEGRVHHLDLDVTHRRTLIFQPGEWLMVFDMLDSPERHRYTQWFHLDPALQVEAGSSTHTADLRDGAGTLRIHTACLGSGKESYLCRGQESPRVQGWVSTRYRQTEPAFSLGSTTVAENGLMIAALVIEPTGVESRLSSDPTETGWQVSLSTGDGRTEFECSGEGVTTADRSE